MAETESADEITPARRTEVSVNKNGRKNKVIVEQSAAEGLPPGWIKELKIKKTSGRLRRDPYYTDPKTGYIFRSFKDALRYVKTGKIGKQAFKPKDDEVDAKDGKSPSPAESMEEKLVERETDEKRMDGDLNVHEANKDEKINIYVRSKRKGTASPVLRSGSNLVVNEEGVEKTAEAKVSKEGKKILCHTPNTWSLEKRVTRSQSQAKKDNDNNQEPEPKMKKAINGNDDDCELKRKKVINGNDNNGELKSKKGIDDNLPRRASKRLAGIELELTRELETRTRAPQTELEVADSSEKMEMPSGSAFICQSAVGKSNKEVPRKCGEPSLQKANFGFDSCKKMETLSFSTRTRQSVMEQSDKLVPRRCEGPSSPKPNLCFGSCKKTELPSVSTRAHQSAVKGSNEVVTAECEGPSAPKRNLSFNNCKKTEEPSAPKVNLPLGSNKMMEVPSVSAPTCRTATELLDEAVTRKPSNVLDGSKSTKTPLVSNKSKHVSTDFAAAVSYKANDGISRPPPPLELPLADLWKDPCIAFAIKTLTTESLDPPIVSEISKNPKSDGLGNTREEKAAVLENQLGLAENSHKINGKPGSSLELPDSDIWKDPCIEFAIKTLTGAIPVGLDPVDTQTKSQQPAMGLLLPPQGPATNFSQSDYLLQQFNLKHKPASGGACFSQRGTR